MDFKKTLKQTYTNTKEEEKTVLDLNKVVIYKELLDEQGELKSNQELKCHGIKMDWWLYLQIRTRYKNI